MARCNGRYARNRCALLVTLPLAHLQELQPHTVRPFEKADVPSIRQDTLFKYFDASSFDLRHLAGEVFGIDRDVLKTIKLLQLLIFEKVSHAELHAMQIDPKSGLAVRRWSLRYNFCTDMLNVPVHGFAWL